MPIVGIFRFSSNLSFGDQGLAATPIEQTRRLTGLTGYHQISVAVEDKGAIEEVRRRIQARARRRARWSRPRRATASRSPQQLDALNILLYFFSGIALFVGGFLILNSFNMTVLQRMREIGTLRTLGASRGLVTRTILTEAAVIGALGSVLGLGLGLGLAAGLIELMRGMEMPVGALHVTAGPAITAVVLGMVVTLLGAAWPARRAGRVSPIRAVLGARGMRRTPRARRALIGLALLLPGVVLGGDSWSGDAGALGDRPLDDGDVRRHRDAGAVRDHPDRPRARLAAAQGRSPRAGDWPPTRCSQIPSARRPPRPPLTIGLSVVVVNSGLSSSFMGTIERPDRAHLHARLHGPGGRRHARHRRRLGRAERPARTRSRRMPETRAATPIRALILDLPGVEEGGPQGMAVGYDPEVYGLMDGTRDGRHVARGGAARRRRRRPDRRGPVRPHGRPRARRPRAPRRPARHARGACRRHPRRHVQLRRHGAPDLARHHAPRLRRDHRRADRGPRALGRAGARRSAAASTRSSPTATPASSWPRWPTSARPSRSRCSATFNMFNSIVAIAVIVSLLGVVNTLAMSVLERTREIGVLRALGSSRWQVRRTMLDESLLITTAGALAGIAFGLVIALSWMRGFAETMPGLTFHFPGATAFAVAAAAIVLGTLAAVLPARRAARLKVIEALAYE